MSAAEIPLSVLSGFGMSAETAGSARKANRDLAKGIHGTIDTIVTQIADAVAQETALVADVVGQGRQDGAEDRQEDREAAGEEGLTARPRESTRKPRGWPRRAVRSTGAYGVAGLPTVDTRALKVYTSPRDLAQRSPIPQGGFR